MLRYYLRFPPPFGWPKVASGLPHTAFEQRARMLAAFCNLRVLLIALVLGVFAAFARCLPALAAAGCFCLFLLAEKVHEEVVTHRVEHCSDASPCRCALHTLQILQRGPGCAA